MNEKKLTHPMYQKNKPKWNDLKEYRRLRASYTIDTTQSKQQDTTDLFEKNDRFYSKLRNKKVQCI